MSASENKPLHDVEEATLVARAHASDPQAVRTIMQRNNQRLFRLARSVVGDDAEAEDVVQEAYGRAFTSPGDFRGEASVGAWLGRIVINEALGRLRGARRTVELSSVENHLTETVQIIPFPAASMQPDPERMMAQRQIQKFLERSIDNLPDAFRSVLIMRVIEGMSIEETAELLQIRPETVKTRRAAPVMRNWRHKQLLDWSLTREPLFNVDTASATKHAPSPADSSM